MADSTRSRRKIEQPEESGMLRLFRAERRLGTRIAELSPSAVSRRLPNSAHGSFRTLRLGVWAHLPDAATMDRAVSSRARIREFSRLVHQTKPRGIGGRSSIGMSTTSSRSKIGTVELVG
jgi:hypothetical protein